MSRNKEHFARARRGLEKHGASIVGVTQNKHVAFVT
jgi:hypothetical protein